MQDIGVDETSARKGHGNCEYGFLSPMVGFYGIMNAMMPGIDNGMAGSINSKIQKVKKMACGFRNVERFQNAIMFHFGGLDLYPALPTR